MKLLTVSFVVLCLAAYASARPRYIAIPVDDIQFLSFGPAPLDDGSVRVARQAGSYAPSSAYIQEDTDAASSEGRSARQAHHGHHGHHGHGHHGHHDGHDYVDYGAHTGHHGAFGWHADFPVHAHEH